MRSFIKNVSKIEFQIFQRYKLTGSIKTIKIWSDDCCLSGWLKTLLLLTHTHAHTHTHTPLSHSLTHTHNALRHFLQPGISSTKNCCLCFRETSEAYTQGANPLKPNKVRKKTVKINQQRKYNYQEKLGHKWLQIISFVFHFLLWKKLWNIITFSNFVSSTECFTGLGKLNLPTVDRF